MNERRKILEDVNGYLIEKLKEVPNMARIEMSICRRAVIWGRDHVVKLNNEQPGGVENGQ